MSVRRASSPMPKPSVSRSTTGTVRLVEVFASRTSVTGRVSRRSMRGNAVKGARMTLADPAPSTPAARLKGWDSIELWVGNARAMAGFLCSAFGFHASAYAGPETGVPDKSSYLLEQGGIRLVVTAGLTPDSPIWAHVREHGDGAHDLAFVVDDAEATFAAAVARGARSVEEPYERHDEHGV